MSISKVERSSEWTFVRSVTRVEYNSRQSELSLPDGCWDIVVFRNGRSAGVMITGNTTRPVRTINNPGDELLCISFKPGVYMPSYAPLQMRDRAVMLSKPRTTMVRLGSEVLEIPSFESADDFVKKLATGGLLSHDELVASMFEGDRMAASIRSRQRHFLQSTGLTLSRFQQIERARRAADLLRDGQAGADAALEAGYYDQSHMINSLKAILGQTPKQIVQSR